jgi:hypothetical protein
VADGVQGRATLIACLDDRHYAFFRGVDLHAHARPQQRGAGGGGLEIMGKDSNFRNTVDFDHTRASNRAGNCKFNLDKSVEGVQIIQVK